MTSEPEANALPSDGVLESLVGDVDFFADHHWGRRPMLRSHAELDAADDRFAELLDLDDVDRVVAGGARTPSFRLVRDGARLDPSASTQAIRLGGRVLDDVADPRAVAHELAQGATLVLQGLHRTWAPVDDWCRRLEDDLGHPVQANAYLTPCAGSGLAPHHDEHDVFVLQVSGAKAWDIDGLGDIVLEPGDVAYLPAGTRHVAAATRGTMSLHLTIGVLQVTVGDVLRRLLTADATSGWNRALPLGFHDPDRAASLRKALEQATVEVADALGSVDLDDVVRHEADRRRRQRRRSGLGRVSSVARLHELDGSSWVSPCHDRPARLVAPATSADRVVVQLEDRRLTMPGAMRDAVTLLLDRPTTKVQDLPGLEPDDRLVLVRRLVREGVLDVVDRPGAERGR
jgi:mannose-6-phosphate isomerase-like protein (cupin superfamily)